MEIPSTHFSELKAFRNRIGEQAAKERLLVRYRDVIFHWCLRRLHSEHDAEDLTQEVLLKLLKTLPSEAYDPSRSRFRSWLKSVVNNAITDFCRKQERNHAPQVIGGTTFGERVNNVPDARPTAEATSVDMDEQAMNAAEIVKHVKASSSNKSWEIFHQATVERRPAPQIANDFGVTVGAVYKTTFRVKQRLMKEYQDVYRVTSLS